MANFLNTVSAMGALVMAATPLMAIGSLAHAETQPVRIQVADLDFSRPADVVAFRQRVDSAAETLCGHSTGMVIPAACRAAVREEAVKKLGSDQQKAMQTASAATAWKVAGN